MKRIVMNYVRRNEMTMLLYHGVTDSSSRGIENYSGKHVRKDDFAAQMKTVKSKCRPLSVDEVVEYHRSGKDFPPGSVVVTFDDGFKNNHAVAAPILADLGVPAVFYLTTGFIGSERMAWVDIVEDCVNRCAAERIRLHVDGADFDLPLASPNERVRAVETVKGHLKRAKSDVKDRVIAELPSITGVTPSVAAADNYRKLGWGEVRELSASPLFTIGGHSVNHNVLSAVSEDEMRSEIGDCIAKLESELQREVRHFAYPEGQAHHYNDRVIEALKGYGIACCPSAIDGTNVAADDLFHLKRIMVGFMGRAFPL